MLPTNSRNHNLRWESEKLFFSSKEFFNQLLIDIEQAQESIIVETYIFQLDKFGTRFFSALSDAAKRGLRVQLLVDGVGSWGWSNWNIAELSASGVETRIYHPIPWPLSKFYPSEATKLQGYFHHWANVNQRNHKKVYLVDKKIAYVGSMNIHDDALVWRETGIRIVGEQVLLLLEAFEQVWQESFYPGKRKRGWFSTRKVQIPSSHDLVLLNPGVKHRRKLKRIQSKRLKQADKRIWMVTPYFVPTVGLIKALSSAALNKLDVRILLPLQVDHKFMNWVMNKALYTLIQAGVRVYRYQEGMMHQKVLLIDDWVQTGSSNVNRRSYNLDLEVDIVLSHEETRMAMEHQLCIDFERSIMLSLKDLEQTTWAERLLGWIFSLMKPIL